MKTRNNTPSKEGILTSLSSRAHWHWLRLVTLIVLSRCLQLSVLSLQSLITSPTRKCLTLGDKRPPQMCLLLIWPAASGQSEARHQPSVAILSPWQPRTDWLHSPEAPGPGWPGPSPPRQSPATDTGLCSQTCACAQHTFTCLLWGEADGRLQQAGTNICMHFYEPVSPWPLSPSAMSDSCLVGGGRDYRHTDTGHDVMTQITHWGVRSVDPVQCDVLTFDIWLHLSWFSKFHFSDSGDKRAIDLFA